MHKKLDIEQLVRETWGFPLGISPHFTAAIQRVVL
jgi:hypothetical protein